MIDAYEIGIQLALQDDVSAGLQVINQGLAEVDRAIDATSAKLAALTQTAEAATGKAAAGVTMRPATVAVPAEMLPVAEAASAIKAERRTAEPAAAPIVSKSEAGASAEEKGIEDSAHKAIALELTKVSSAAPAPEAEVSSGPGRVDPTNMPVTMQVQHSIEAAAPVRSVEASAPIVPEGDGKERPASFESSAPAASLPPSIAPQKMDASAKPLLDKNYTSSVAAAIAPARMNRGGETVAASSVTPSATTAEPVRQATAPWSGVEMRMSAPRSAETADRAAAPSARQQDRSEGMTGSVMLDGHLVGYWLAEQMAKEASRPPTGTSFFDPRQTPAWTASGSL